MLTDIQLLQDTQLMSVADALLKKYALRGAPVVSEQGELLGTLSLSDIEQLPLSQRTQQSVATQHSKN